MVGSLQIFAVGADDDDADKHLLSRSSSFSSLFPYGTLYWLH